ncbi:MAG: sulfide/dihydroorotate dehydrogenase-like FAD/NAD-binding protein [Candidatus Omnitrophica bacterium]|jgi:ferredoxin--NADP+ reductase|nr:sulfide/dihydroorotate dehydrogenase-like FAD/NAD-binding protein [Candidatus Omnitrophota bacterium]MDD5252969.1 sulfide/dihydroorotate dehydrogenase-like FAD/NAD-binding protein [Candidatus Omnitrophota bacterium]
MKIINKKIINDVGGVRITQLDIEAGDIASKALPGQFIMLMVSEKGERIPLTLVNADKNKGIISLIFQEAGFTTKSLGKLNPGDTLYSLVGPLGHPTEIKKFGKVILVGGGVGIAEILPVAQALKEAGNHITTILGSRNKDLLILEAELKNTADEIYIMTDDGSYGRKGFTTDMLKELLSKDKYDLIYSVGPIPMMKRVALVSKEYNTKTLVSLNALMVDATGMCGCCRVSVSGEVKFSCVDGPDFDGHGVDWEELEKRNKVYSVQEKHICNLFPGS